MGTTNILDLNNRVDELAESYPADKVMLSDGVTSVENALDSLTDDSGWVTVVANHLFYRKIGKLVEVQISTKELAISSSAWTTIGTLPEGVRPHSNRRFTPFAFDDKSFMVNISGNGIVEYESNNTFNINTCIMYFAD